MSVGGAGRKRDVSAPPSKLPSQAPVKETKALEVATPVAPKDVPTTFQQNSDAGEPVSLEWKSAQTEPSRQSGGLGFDTISNEPPKVMREEGRQASVGLDATKVYQPGDRLPVLEGLPADLHKLQLEVNAELETNPQLYVERYRMMVHAQDGVPTFATDDAKAALRPEEWLGPDGLTPEVKEFRAGGANAAMHQAAHAAAQMAFLKELDEMVKPDGLGQIPPDDPRRNILVTNGGCGAGKGYALKQGLSADFKNQFGAIWDAAGEQAGLDNRWIIEEAAKRGIKVTLVHVNADPVKAFVRAVTKRYHEEGRLVNTRSFTESYVDGAENMRAIIRDFDKQPGNIELVVVDNTGPEVNAATFTRENIREAQKYLTEVIPLGWEDAQALHAELKKWVPEGMTDVALRGLTLLD